MDTLDRLKAATGETDEDGKLTSYMESAKAAILRKRFPYGDWPDEVEPQYTELLYQCALALYNKEGAEFETSHTENGISRSWGSEGIPAELLAQVIPKVSVL